MEISLADSSFPIAAGNRKLSLGEIKGMATSVIAICRKNSSLLGLHLCIYLLDSEGSKLLRLVWGMDQVSATGSNLKSAAADSGKQGESGVWLPLWLHAAGRIGSGLGPHLYTYLLDLEGGELPRVVWGAWGGRWLGLSALYCCLWYLKVCLGFMVQQCREGGRGRTLKLVDWANI